MSTGISQPVLEHVDFENSVCPLGCKTGDEHVVEAPDLVNHLPGRFTIVQCLECGLQRTNPRPTRASMGVFYPDDYAPYKEPSTSLSSSIRRILQTAFFADSKRLLKSPPGVLLDVGCASGGYLAQAARDGWNVEGAEFSETAAEVARWRGFKVLTGQLETMDLPTLRYDVVTAWMVLEHLHDPLGALGRVHQSLKPGGHLVISVPDIESIARKHFLEDCYDLHLPNHLFHYSSRTIERVLDAAGFRVIKTRWQGNSHTLLMSMLNTSQRKGFGAMESSLNFVISNKLAYPLRLILRLGLKITKSSGRIVVIAEKY